MINDKLHYRYTDNVNAVYKINKTLIGQWMGHDNRQSYYWKDCKVGASPALYGIGGRPTSNDDRASVASRQAVLDEACDKLKI